jgi:hypothetical protein
MACLPLSGQGGCRHLGIMQAKHGVMHVCLSAAAGTIDTDRAQQALQQVTNKAGSTLNPGRRQAV